MLTNPKAERVAKVRMLANRSARQRHGLFLVEGPQAVREAVRYASALVNDVYLTADAAKRYPEITDAAADARIYTHLAAPEVVAAMSADAQGIVAVLRLPRTSLAEVLEGSEPVVSGTTADSAPWLPAAAPGQVPGVAQGRGVVAVLHNVRDPGNAGTVIRAADAAGARGVVMTGDSVDLYNPKVVRSTAGSLFHQPVVVHQDLPDVVGHLHTAGYLVLAADGAAELDLDDLADAAQARRFATAWGVTLPEGDGALCPDLRRPTAWIFGNEAWGLRPADRDLADAAVRVPIRGIAESLNLATAATVCLYASSRAQRA